MVDAHAESKGAHLSGVGDLVDNLLQDESNPGIVSGVEIAQLVNVVAGTALPTQAIEGNVVVGAKVLKRTQQTPLERLPQPQLHSGAPAEPMPDIQAVRALGRGSEPEQHFRL